MIRLPTNSHLNSIFASLTQGSVFISDKNTMLYFAIPDFELAICKCELVWRQFGAMCFLACSFGCAPFLLQVLQGEIAMYRGYSDYERFICEQGLYYPMIFTSTDDGGIYVYVPIKDGTDDISVGYGKSFAEAYRLARQYLINFRIHHGRFPKYVNPYHIETEDNEFLVMVKIYAEDSL